MGSYLSRTICALIFAQALFFGNSLFAQFLVPTSGPEGGYVLDMTELSSGILYACVDQNEIFESHDDGQHWQPMFPQSFENPRVIASDSQDRLYTYTGEREFLRLDSVNGLWHYLEDLPIPPESESSWFLRKLIIDSQDRLFALGEASIYGGMLFTSFDYGDSWQEISAGAVDTLTGGPLDLTIDNLGRIWIFGRRYNQPAFPYYLFRYDPDSQIWEDMTVNGEHPVWLYSDAEQYVYTYDHYDESVFRFDTSDESWTELHPLTPNGNRFRLLHVAQDATLFSEQSDGIYGSTDHGDTWTRFGNFPCFSYVGLRSALNGDVYLQSYYDGLFKLDEDSQNWIQSFEGVQASNVYGFEFTEDGSVYAKGSQLTYKSSDRGESWSHVFGSMRLLNRFDGEPSLLFAVSGDSLYRSEDEGVNWSVSLPFRILTIEETMQGTLIAGSDSLWRSEDRGLTWNLVPNLDDFYNYLYYYSPNIVVNGDAIFAYASEIFFFDGVRSTDDGLTWEALTDIPDVELVTLIPDAEGHLFVVDRCYGSGFYRSDDQGETWLELDGLPISTAENGPTILFPVSDGRLLSQYNSYFGNESDGAIFESSDYGESWARIQGNYPRINRFAEDADGYLYAGTNGSGVYISSESILPISPATNPLPTEFTLYQNYPNPFNSTTNFAFDLPATGPVTMQIFDITGRLAATPLSGNLTAGHYNINWDANSLASGIYFYSLKTDLQIQTRKLTLIK